MIRHTILAVLGLILALGAVSYAEAGDAGPAAEVVAAIDAGAVGGPVAPGAVDPATDPVGTLLKLVTAIRDTDWRLVAALALSLLIAGLRWVVARQWWEEQSKRLKAATVLAISLAGALVTSLLAGAPVNVGMFLRAGEVAVLAGGGYALLWSSLVRNK